MTPNNSLLPWIVPCCLVTDFDFLRILVHLCFGKWFHFFLHFASNLNTLSPLLRWLHSCHRSAKWISWFYQTILASVFTNFITCYDPFHEIYDFISEKKYIMYILIQNRMYDPWTKCIIYTVISMSNYAPLLFNLGM